MTNTILLADDSVTIQKVIELTFMDEDYEVVAVGNGDEALDRLEELTPDVVIADVHMPGASGYDVAKRAKQLHPQAPVLLLVGTFEPFDESDYDGSGADAVLKKPFDSQELLQRVSELMQAHAGAAAGAAPEAAADEGDEAPAFTPDTLAVAAEPAGAEEPPVAAADAAGAGEDEMVSVGSMAEESFEPGWEDEKTDTWRVTPPEDVEGPGAVGADLGTRALSGFGSALDEEGPAEETVREGAWAPWADEVPAAASQEEAAEATADEEPAWEPDPTGWDPMATGAGGIPVPAVEAADDDEPPAAEPDAEATPFSEAEPGPAFPDASAEEEPFPELDRPAPGGGAVSGVPEPAADAAGAVEAGRLDGLSDDDVERVARRVVEILGTGVLQEVAWEVVPDLAEVVIKDRLRELESQLD